MVEKQFEAMVLKINQMDEQMYSTVSVAKEKGLILEKTRLMSMEFSKLKVSIMKGKLPNEERMKLLTALRPIENTIKETLKLSEIHSQNLLSKQDSNNSNVWCLLFSNCNKCFFSNASQFICFCFCFCFQSRKFKQKQPKLWIQKYHINFKRLTILKSLLEKFLYFCVSWRKLKKCRKNN